MDKSPQASKPKDGILTCQINASRMLGLADPKKTKFSKYQMLIPILIVMGLFQNASASWPPCCCEAQTTPKKESIPNPATEMVRRDPDNVSVERARWNTYGTIYKIMPSPPD